MIIKLANHGYNDGHDVIFPHREGGVKSVTPLCTNHYLSV